MIVIDRFEDDMAWLDADGDMVGVRRDALPGGAREGDLLRREGGRYVVDEAATRERHARVQEKRRRVLGRTDNVK